MPEEMPKPLADLRPDCLAQLGSEAYNPSITIQKLYHFQRIFFSRDSNLPNAYQWDYLHAWHESPGLDNDFSASERLKKVVLSGWTECMWFLFIEQILY